MKKSTLCLVAFAVGSIVANAADSVWIGGADGAWTNAANWSVGVPGATDTATFGAQGANGATSIDLTDMALVGKILVTGADAPKYAFGTDASQILLLPFDSTQDDDGTGFFVDATVPPESVPEIVATIGGQVVPGTGNMTYQVIANDSSGTLAINDFGMLTGGDGKQNYLIFHGAGPTEVNGTLVWGEETDRPSYCYGFSLNDAGKVRFRKSMSGIFRMHSAGTDATIMRTMEIDKDVTIAIYNDWPINPGAPIQVIGEGVLKVNNGRQYMQGVLNVGGLYSNVFEVAMIRDNVLTGELLLYGKGVYHFNHSPSDIGRLVTFQFPSGDSSMGWVTFAAPSIGMKGTETGVCPAIEQFRFVNRGCLRYTGPGETMDRDLVFANQAANSAWNFDSRMRIESCGTGDFVVTSAISSDDGAAGASLYLAGNGADGIMQTALVDQPSHSLTLTKEGAGRWVLKAANTFTGATTVNGGTLALGEGGTLENSPMSLNGGMFAVTAAEQKSISSVSVDSGLSHIALADGATLSVASMSRVGTGLLDVSLGTGSSFVCEAMAGAAPSWLTVNGRAAEFGADGRLARMDTSLTDSIAARGGVIPDGAEKIVGIVTPGESGTVTLEKDSTAIATLVQRAAVDATVAMPSETLTLSTLMIDEGAANLTIGAAPGEGTLSAPAGDDLVVNNYSDRSTLTVNANLDVPSDTVALKSGTMALSETSYAGEVVLSEGTTLVLTNESDVSMTVKPVQQVAGNSSKVVRTGNGLMKYSLDLSSYKGDFVLAGGTNEISATLCGTGKIKSFGSEDGDLYVTNGATLFVNDNGIVTSGTSQHRMTFGNKNIHFAGTGANGSGAYIVRDYHPSVLNYATLDDDALFVLESGSYVEGYLQFNKQLDMKGHTITVKGDGYLVFPRESSVINAGRMDLYAAPEKKLRLSCYPNFDLGPSAAPPVVMRDRVYINSYRMGNFNRAILVDATAVTSDECPGLFPVYGDQGTNLNHLAGPFTFADSNTGEFRYSNSSSQCAPATLTIGGPISGPGGFRMFRSKDRGCLYLAHSNNTFTGGVTIEGDSSFVDAAIKLGHPTSAPDHSRLSVTNGRIIAVAPNWKAEEILSLASSATLGGDSFVSVDTEGCKNSTYSMEIDGSVLSDRELRLAHDGVGTLSVTASGTFAKPMAFGSFGGTLEFSGGKVTLGRGLIANNALATTAPEVRFCNGVEATLAFGPITLGAQTRMAPNRIARMKIVDATVKSDGSAAADHAQEAAFIVGGGKYGDAILEIGEGADVATGLQVCNGKSHGAVHQTGGTIDATGSGAWGGRTWIGYSNGYAAYLQSGGSFHCGHMLMALGRDNYATIRQSGGNACFCNLNMGCFGPLADWVVSGGHAAVTNQFSLPRAGSDVYDTRAVFTAEGSADVDVTGYVHMAAGLKGVTAIVNLNGGRISARGFKKYGVEAWQEDQAGNRAYVNFNGGTFAAAESRYDIFATGVNAVDSVTVYEGGATIDTSAIGADGHITVSQPLSAPTGLGVASVPFVGDIVVTNDFVGPPGVLIIGDGYGATAVCDFDLKTRSVTGVRVLTPGRDYTWAKAVLDYGCIGEVRAVVTNDCTLTSATPVSGGLTKKGDGRLILNSANTYAGETVLEGGELVVNVNGAVPSASTIVFKGGTLSVGEGVSLAGAAFRLDLLQNAQCPGSFTFPSGASVTVDNLDKVDRSVGSYTVATFAGGVSGDLPTLVNAEDMPCSWRIMTNGKQIKVRYMRGTVLSVR